MSAIVLQFPRRGPWRIEVEREHGGDGWLVRARDHGWSHGSLVDALADAARLARDHGVAIAIHADLRSEEIASIASGFGT